MSDSFLPPVVAVISASLSEFTAKVGEAKAEMSAMESHADQVSKVGKIALGALALGATAVAVESLKMAGDFQKNTNLLVTAAGETQDNLGLVRDGILNIAKSTGTSTEMLTEGMYQVEKAGFRGAGGLAVLKAATQGAAEEGANLGTVTNAMTSIMASYHLGTEQSVEVMNALKTAAGGSKDTMENFASSLSTVLPIASAAHLDFAQVGGAIATLTRHGTSAAEATQELAFTIRNLQAPNKVAVKAMEQMGISAVDVSQNLGQRGLGGTLEYLVDTIGKHMGPSGLVLIDTFKKSQSAAADMNAMIAAMPPELQKIAQGYRDGSLTMGDYNKAIASIPATQANLAKQFEVLANRSTGFSDALRSGSPQAQTMNSQLKAMLGGSTGLNTALMITGENQAYLNEMTTKTSESLHHQTSDVEGWNSTSKLMNIQLNRLKQGAEVFAIELGTHLIPAVTGTIDWFSHHTVVAESLAGVIGGVLTIAIGMYVGGLVKAAYESTIAFGKMMVSGAAWVADQLLGFSVVAAGWVYQTALMLRQAAVWAAGMLAAGVEALLPFAPIILAVAAVGIAAYELYKHWDQVWGFIKSATSAAWSFIEQHMVLISALFGPVAVAAALLYKHWDQVWGAIRNTVKAAWDFIQPIIDAISSAVSSVTDAVGSLGGAAKSVLGGAGSALHHLGIPGFASGTDYAPGGLSIVGEDGPEILNLPRGAQVTNARDTRSLLTGWSVGVATGSPAGGSGGSGGGGDTVVYVTVQGTVVSERNLIDAVYQGLIVKRQEKGALGLA